MPKNKTKLIINPNADLGRAWRLGEDLNRVVAEFGGADCAGTVYPSHATQLAIQAADEGYETVVSIGGDGTTHEVINDDTAFLHSASALSVPVAAIFGYTNYRELYPWKTKYEIIRKDLDCSPCFFNSPKYAKCKWKGMESFKCMKNIETEEVYTACRLLLS